MIHLFVRGSEPLELWEDERTAAIRCRRLTAAEFCRELGVRFQELTPQLAEQVVAAPTRASKRGDDGGGRERKAVTLGDLAQPFALVRFKHGRIQHQLRSHDLNRVLTLSAETVKELARIFDAAGHESQGNTRVVKESDDAAGS